MTSIVTWLGQTRHATAVQGPHERLGGCCSTISLTLSKGYIRLIDWPTGFSRRTVGHDERLHSSPSSPCLPRPPPSQPARTGSSLAQSSSLILAITSAKGHQSLLIRDSSAVSSATRFRNGTHRSSIYRVRPSGQILARSTPPPKSYASFRASVVDCMSHLLPHPYPQPRFPRQRRNRPPSPPLYRQPQITPRSISCYRLCTLNRKIIPSETVPSDPSILPAIPPSRLLRVCTYPGAQ